MKKAFVIALAALMLVCAVFTAVSCNTQKNDGEQQSQTNAASGENQNDESNNPASAGIITLSSSGADVANTGAVYENGVLTISGAGSYTITGSCDAIAVVVAVEKTEQVELVLDNASITNPKGPAVYCSSADKLFVTAKAGTENYLKDGKSYSDTTGPNAALFCDDDLTVRGEGSLTVTGLYKNGISSKNDIKIKDLTLKVDAYNTGIRGKDSVTVVSGNITVKAGKDGIKSSEAEKEGKGFVTIEDGTVSIVAEDDALQAANVITITAGSVTAKARGKITNAPTVNVADGTLNA